MIKLVTEQIVIKIPDNFTGIAHYEDGVVIYFKNGKMHREDGPAYIAPNGYESCYFEGKRHNLNGPAISWEHGKKDYWIDGIPFSKENWEKEVVKLKNPCQDVFVEVDGKKYKLVEV